MKRKPVHAEQTHSTGISRDVVGKHHSLLGLWHQHLPQQQTSAGCDRYGQHEDYSVREAACWAAALKHHTDINHTCQPPPSSKYLISTGDMHDPSMGAFDLLLPAQHSSGTM